MGRPNRKWQLLGVVGTVALAVGVCLLVPGAGGEKKKPTSPPPAADKSGKAPKPASTGTEAMDLPVTLKDGIGHLGSPDAKVKIDVFFPGHGGCGRETADFAHRVYQANKNRVLVTFVDFESSGGSKYQGAAGMHCSGLAVNGRQKFEVELPGGTTQTVELASNYGDRWDDAKFLRVLDAVFNEAYGEPANHKLPAAKPPGSVTPVTAAPKVPSAGGKP